MDTSRDDSAVNIPLAIVVLLAVGWLLLEFALWLAGPSPVEIQRKHDAVRYSLGLQCAELHDPRDGLWKQCVRVKMNEYLEQEERR